MKTKWIPLFSLLLIFVGQLAFSQAPTDKYWVMFRDKGDLSALKPQDFLTQRSLDRRARMGIALAPSDYPVARTYMTGVNEAGATLLYPSKWFNAVSVRMDAATAAQVATLPYVKQIKRIPKVIVDMEDLSQVARPGYSSGFCHNQLDMVGLDKMHRNGYNGKGILICMMDNGFYNADKNPYLKHLFDSDRIIATRDFVNQEENVYNEGDHGQFTLSIVAGLSENSNDTDYWFTGSAHGASFILCQTENNTSETHQEEDNWVAAMEYADSLGADLFSTSLGYRTLDNDSYTYADMDGNTTIITIGADMAAAKGIVVVNAAGNDGTAKMLAPSDGDSVISVGAVDSMRVIAGFSALGPSADGRIKPDISTMGFLASYLRSSGILSQGNGTSFACPIAAGLAACLLQSAPQASNMQIYHALIQSADRHDRPDTIYGYGIPYGPEAYRLLTGQTLAGTPAMSQLEADSIEVYPNPAMSHFSVAIDNGPLPWTGLMDIVDMGGRVVWSRRVEVGSFYNVFRYTRVDDYPQVVSGRYQLRIRPLQKEGTAKATYSTPIMILTQR
jgi:serine protease AprX